LLDADHITRGKIVTDAAWAEHLNVFAEDLPWAIRWYTGRDAKFHKLGPERIALPYVLPAEMRPPSAAQLLVRNAAVILKLITCRPTACAAQLARPTEV